ncbi:MAG: tRNA uridine-5-carboxymethylaminomethyl(34) synthesis GTPase MnmE [Pseudomonadota bacterium]
MDGLRSASDTIAAIATGAGEAGVGILRLSGPASQQIAIALTKRAFTPRMAHYCLIHDHDGSILDRGLVLSFPGPDSFTGEDVVEFHCHGSPVLLDTLLRSCAQLGARYANAGEFSQRAFMNGKIDLAQAEAIADLISSGSDASMRAACRSLTGVFSQRIDEVFEALVSLRAFIEAAIDFPEEEIDFLKNSDVLERIQSLLALVETLLTSAKRGRALHRGLKLVIAGAPNAGKSSLMNQLVEKQSSIVTAQAGTTRDVIRERLAIRGLPVEIVDTAGLRNSDDPIEREGVKRATEEIRSADQVLLVCDDSMSDQQESAKDLINIFREETSSTIPVTLVRNKCDLSGRSTGQRVMSGEGSEIPISALSGEGIDVLRDHLLAVAGLENMGNSEFSARARHLDALERCLHSLRSAAEQLAQYNAPELAAEELRLAQENLGEITGRYSSDQLLGDIFGRFCIGK